VGGGGEEGRENFKETFIVTRKLHSACSIIPPFICSCCGLSLVVWAW
jgi:hypothetical protein